jgi:hypothetical protein
MRLFRKLMGVLIPLCLVPPLVLVAAALIGRWTGCRADPDAVHACQMIGGDYGGILFSMMRFGQNTGASLLILAALLVSWLLIEIMRAIGGAPRKTPAAQTPASSRNRERGS